MADPHRYPPIDDRIRARVRKRVREGLSIAQTAVSVGRPKRAVAQVVRELGGVKTIRGGDDRR